MQKWLKTTKHQPKYNSIFIIILSHKPKWCAISMNSKMDKSHKQLFIRLFHESVESQ